MVPEFIRCKGKEVEESRAFGENRDIAYQEQGRTKEMTGGETDQGHKAHGVRMKKPTLFKLVVSSVY